MAMTDLTAFTPDANRYGENVARTNRILTKLLLDWPQCEEPGRVSKDKSKSRPQFLTAIYFDKLAELFCRIWDQLRNDRKVRFPSAYKSFRGIHGPGRAMPIDRKKDEEESLGKDPNDYRRHKIAYTTEIAEKLDPSIGLARNLFDLSGAPAWSYLCRVCSQLAPNQWESWLNDPENEGDDCAFLETRELDLVSKISEVIQKLTKHELRALGTHSNANQTIEAIQFNIHKWEEAFAKVIHLLRQDFLSELITQEGARLLYISHELRKKSIENERHYKKAIKKVGDVLAVVQDADLKGALEKVQAQSVEEIWGDNTVRRYADHVDNIVALSAYLRTYTDIICDAGTVTDKRRKETEQAAEELVKLGSYLGIFFPGPSKMKKEDRKDIAYVCESAKDLIWKYLPPVPKSRKTGVP